MRPHGGAVPRWAVRRRRYGSINAPGGSSTTTSGLPPSARLRRLEEQILLQDPDLEPIAVATANSAASLIVENPYLGLRVFQEQDESRFFGRDDLVGRILERVSDDVCSTAVVGPSGSGKSSVVQAGVIPRSAAISRRCAWPGCNPALNHSPSWRLR